MSPLRRQEAVAGFAFLLPNIVGFAIFVALPVAAALVLSFFHWDLLTPPRFAGLSNFTKLFTEDRTFRVVLVNTVYYVVGTVPPSITLALLVALAMNQKIRGVTFYRTAYFMPVVSSLVAVSLIWRWLFNYDFGLVNNLLYSVGITNVPNWLGSSRWAMPAVIIMSIWRNIGYNMVIYLAGLQDIPDVLYEAAAIDGAGSWQKFRHVTLPLLTPTTFFLVVISIINSFQVFTQALVLTEGGPGDATNTIVFYIYKNAFQWLKMGYAAAVAWVLFVIIFIITLIQFRMQRKWVHYQ